jgi:hypothetical protein
MAANHIKFYLVGNHKQFWKPCRNDCVCKQHGSGRKLKKGKKWHCMKFSVTWCIWGCWFSSTCTNFCTCRLIIYLQSILNAVSSSDNIVSTWQEKTYEYIVGQNLEGSGNSPIWNNTYLKRLSLQNVNLDTWSHDWNFNRCFPDKKHKCYPSNCNIELPDYIQHSTSFTCIFHILPSLQQLSARYIILNKICRFCF